MKIPINFVIFSIVNLKCAKPRVTDATLPVQDRIALLKLQIAEEIKNKQVTSDMIQPIDDHDFGASYEYEDITEPFTPIMDFDSHKKYGKLKKLKTTPDPDEVELSTTNPTTKSNKRHKVKEKLDFEIEEKKEMLSRKGFEYDSDESSTKEIKMDGIEAAFSELQSKPTPRIVSLAMPTIKVKHHKGQDIARHGNQSLTDQSLQQKISRKKHRSKHRENIFYRRSLYSTRHIRPEWIHCQELISPFLNGHKTNMTDEKIVNLHSEEVRRFLQLLSENVTGSSNDDLYSMIYMISLVKVRLFQWDVAAMKTLFNIIAREPRKVHTFRTLKTGLKSLSESWKLDMYHNTTNLLRQARLFRPPCIRVTPYEGSTKTSKSIRYTKSKKPKCSKEEPDDDD